jgi:hypothetical protein
MQSLKLRREKLNSKEHELRESLANFEKYINVSCFFWSPLKNPNKLFGSCL